MDLIVAPLDIGLLVQHRVPFPAFVGDLVPESAELGHHAKVFRTKTASFVVGVEPDRADRFSVDAEGINSPSSSQGETLLR